MSSLSSDPYKGARDWYPEDMRVRQYIFHAWHKVAQSFGYEAYDTPLLEPVDIYAAKSGQELVSEQTYQFIDRGERRVAIRPEMTPSVSRMIAARLQETPMPARWYNIAQFMRYERPQRGREREFWQLNCDLFGLTGSLAEAETITLGAQLLKALGATDNMFVIRLNNHKIINYMMAHYLGLDTVQAQLMMKLFDRKNKIAPESFRDQAIDIFGPEATPTGLQRIAQLLAAKTMADLPEAIRDSEPVKEIQELFTHLERFGIKNALFDITLMRGLDYYTGTVFEFYDTHPENNRSLFGGGRYDGLVGLFGAEPVSAVGFAQGLTTTQLFLEAHGLIPKLYSTTDIYLISIGNTQRQSVKLAKLLRAEGVNVEIDITDRKLDKQLKTAAKKNIEYTMFVGEEELKTEVYTLKHATTNKELKLSLERVVSTIKDRRHHRSTDDEFILDEIDA
ncbi:histidine--tRNA ligase [Candidatus Saccharibacteria bacterium]|nr:histidine--tRNA ligase [Candidatus Saccharibacteria bacterium]